MFCVAGWIRIVVLTVTIALSAATASLAQTSAFSQGQGFMVKPMRLEALAPPGQQIEVPLQIRNIAGNQTILVNLRMVELSQSIDGGWRLVEPDSPEAAALSSSRQWTRLSTSSATISPMQPVDVVARVSVPASARGVYFAGVVVETPPPENVAGVAVRVRFLVPLVIHIQGRPVRQSVAIDDALLIRRVEPGLPETTAGYLRIANRGQTFSRVRGTLRIEVESDGRWRPVTTVEVPERGIIPGVTLELGNDLQRQLPSGTYRLRGDLYVDGRRVAPREEIMEFEGDPEAESIAYDTALTLTPAVLDLSIAPGGARTSVVRVENPGDAPINVVMAASTPNGLVGVESDYLSGADLSAAQWTEIRPSNFTLAPGRWQNVRVVSRLPREKATHPHYYADLVLSGTYLDGQSAGETRSTVHLANREAETVVEGQIELLQIAERDTRDDYVVQTRVANLGNVAVQPAVRALLINPQGRSVRRTALSGDAGPLLPLGKRTFSGDINLAELPPGYYVLRGVIALGSGREVAKDIVLLLAEEDGSHGVTVLDPTIVDVPYIDLPAAEDSEGGPTDVQ